MSSEHKVQVELGELLPLHGNAAESKESEDRLPAAAGAVVEVNSDFFESPHQAQQPGDFHYSSTETSDNFEYSSPLRSNQESSRLPSPPTAARRSSHRESLKQLKSSRQHHKLIKSPRIVYKGHKQTVISVAVLQAHNEQDTLILSGSEDKSAMVWSLATGELVATLRGHVQRIAAIATLCVEDHAPYAITGSWDETCRIWPLQDCFTSDLEHDALSEHLFAKSIQLKGHKNRVFCLTTILDQQEQPIVASGSADNRIIVWSLAAATLGQLLYEFYNEDEVTWNLSMASFNVPEPKNPQQLVGTKKNPIVGPVLIVGCKNNAVRIWKLRQPSQYPRGSTKPDAVIKGHTSRVHSLAVYDAEKQVFIVTVCRDFDIRIWGLDGELKKTLKGHQSAITCVSAYDCSDARGGAVIVSSSVKGNIRAWKHSTGEMQRIFSGHTEECGVVSVFKSPEKKDDLVVVSGSRDCTCRTWLYAEEKSLNVLYDNGARTKVNAIDVYTPDDSPMVLVVTGSDDGILRCYQFEQGDDDGPQSLVWSVKAHSDRIRSVAIYTPLFMPPIFIQKGAEQIDFNGERDPRLPASHPHQLMVVSGSRTGTMRLSSMGDGQQILWKKKAHAHKDEIRSIVIFPGVLSGAELGEAPKRSAVPPFLVTGSDDNTVKVWNLMDCSLICDTHEHVFDVTGVAVYLPPIPKPSKLLQSGGSGSRTPASGGGSSRSGLQTPSSTVRKLDPIIASSSMDSTLVLMTYTGRCLARLTNSKIHLTSVAVFQLSSGAVVAAGDGDGAILMWALNPPYELLYKLEGHHDEVQCLHMFHPEGAHPVLISGSWDTTVRIWDLSKSPAKFKSTLEGHSAEVMSVKIFAPDGTDAAMVSASTDGTVRCIFDFLGSIPKDDVIRQMFEYDMNGVLSVGTAEQKGGKKRTNWPRITEIVNKTRAEQFFSFHFDLFRDALARQRSDFLVEFLPLTRAGLVKSNVGEEETKTAAAIASLDDDEASDADEVSKLEMRSKSMKLKEAEEQAHLSEYDCKIEKHSLLYHAIHLKDVPAVRVIVDCWIKFLSTKPENDHDLFYAKIAGRAPMVSFSDMLLLADKFPRDFERLVCNIKLMPVQGNKVKERTAFLHDDTEDGVIRLEKFQLSQYEINRMEEVRIRQEAADEEAAAAPNPAVTVDDGTTGASVINYKPHRSESLVSTGSNLKPIGENEELSEVDSDDDGDTTNNTGFNARSSVDSGNGLFKNSAKFNRRISQAGSISMNVFDNVLDNLNVLDNVVDAKNMVASSLRDLLGEEEVPRTWLFLPLDHAAHMEMMKAYCFVCERLDSVAIFDSEAGVLTLSYAWRRFGRGAQLYKMALYLTYILVHSLDTLTFEHTHELYPQISITIMVVQLLLVATFIYEEYLQLFLDPLEYFKDIWNQIDFAVVTGSILGISLRLAYFRETDASKVVYALTAAFAWFNILYYLRAFETTGPLVSMILQISRDMQYVVWVLLIVLLGFSQSFWIVTHGFEDTAFNTFDLSLLNSFSFMLGGFDPGAFDGAPLRPFALFMSCVYMLIVSILLLNLLIALMGDSYAKVAEKGLGQWRLEQAQIITEMAGSMKPHQRTCAASVYFRKNTDEIYEDEEKDTEVSEEQLAIDQLRAEMNSRVNGLEKMIADKFGMIVELLQKQNGEDEFELED